MDKVYLVEHSYEFIYEGRSFEETKLIGTYSTKEKAEDVIQRFKVSRSRSIFKPACCNNIRIIAVLVSSGTFKLCCRKFIIPYQNLMLILYSVKIFTVKCEFGCVSPDLSGFISIAGNQKNSEKDDNTCN